MDKDYKHGQTVYVIMRNPHAQDVANIQEAQVLQDPESDYKLSLLLNESFYPLNDEVAVFQTEREAEQAFKDAFTPKEVKDTLG